MTAGIDTSLRAGLLGGLRGDVLEIGPGDGVNLALYEPGVHWLGIEPDTSRHPALRDEARRLGLTVDVRAGRAEELGLPDASVDAVVSTLVLCSVQDPAAALVQVRRVLRPGGWFVFLEHVAAPRGTWLRRGQAVWSRFSGDDCRADRETGDALAAAGFGDLSYDEFTSHGPLGTRIPFIAGRARQGAAA